MVDLLERYRFFREHAGYVAGRAAESALGLARAERWAEASGLEVSWEWDTCPWDGDEPLPEGTEVYVAVARLGGEVVGALGQVAVSGMRDPYLRVVAAELAWEAWEAERGASRAMAL